MIILVKHKTPTVIIGEQVTVYQYGGGLLSAEKHDGSIQPVSLFDLVTIDDSDILYTFTNGHTHTVAR